MALFVLPKSEYTHSASAKTITLSSSYKGLTAENIKKIINITKDEVIYDSDNITSGITVTGGVVTYTYSGHGADTDVIQVVVDNAVGPGAGVIKTATIALGASLSGAISLQGFKFFAIEMPASWDAANLSFQGSIDGTTYKELQIDGSPVLEVVAADKIYAVNTNAFALATMPFLKVRSGTLATPVNQTAERQIRIYGSY
jgi:hypothetical protein